jgi:signal transduction histidine kinase
MTNGVIAVDQDGMVQTLNQAARDILKVPDEWPPGSPVTHLHPTWGKIFQRLIAEDYEYSNETVEFIPVPLGTSCGAQLSEPLTLRIYTRAMQDNYKKQGGMVAVFENVSELRRVQSQLIQSEKLASVGKLAAGVAHELGNPLGIINSCAIYLADKISKEDPCMEEIEVITHEAQRCRGIIQQLLSLSAREAMNITNLDLRSVIERALTLVHYHQEAGHIVMEWESPEQPVMVRIDENLMIQALVNLLINAVQFMPSGGKVTISLKENEEDNKISLEISDQGIGIPKNQLANIFEPFYTTRENGTGLGLAITHNIIERSGGSISVSSEPGEGTTFTIKLDSIKPESA